MAPELLPQALLEQYEKLLLKFGEVVAELEKERFMRLACQQDLELAETLLSNYHEADQEADLPHHINHNG
jgi:hypothetical protein